MNLEAAYHTCEVITRTQAKNFFYGIRLLPPPKRRAMSALYAVARRIDDIGDGAGPTDARLLALDQVRTQIRRLGEGAKPPEDDAVLVALADVAAQFPLPLAALEELVDGCVMDVTGTRYDTFDQLVGYCRRVAGTIGRLSVAIYGCTDPARGDALADDLGVALQVTNILRDVVEDRTQMGRVYLPAEDRARFGVADDCSGPADALIALICYETGRAEEWYDRGLALLPLLDRRSRACTAAMAGIYRQLLDRIRRDPAAVLQGRMSLPPWEKAAVAARALALGKAA